jgi:hypothetical protein
MRKLRKLKGKKARKALKRWKNLLGEDRKAGRKLAPTDYKPGHLSALRSALPKLETVHRPRFFKP